MKKFSIGDIVICSTWVGNNGEKNLKGEIIKTSGIGGEKAVYLVDFKKNICGHHGEGGRYKGGTCWYVRPEFLTLFRHKEKQIYGIAKFCKEHYR